MEGRSQRKRPNFSYDEPDPDEAPREKKPRFPKGKKESQGIERLLVPFEGEEAGGPIKSTDPRVAHTERAVRRTQLDEQSSNLEDVSLPNDVLGAEEEFQDSHEEEEDGTLLEPFNLNQEREEGFFDAEGNYVEYRNDNDVKDPWLDSAEVDTSLAVKHMKQYAEEEVEHSLSRKDLARTKRRIADALQPGETVLHALRRLKQTSTEKDKNAKAKMSNQTKAAFDMLTEDAMKLLDNGDYNVYHEKKETFEREAEGYESISNARLDLSNIGMHGEATQPGQSSRYSEDIFGSGDEESKSVAEGYESISNARLDLSNIGMHGEATQPGQSSRYSEDIFGSGDEESKSVAEGYESISNARLDLSNIGMHGEATQPGQSSRYSEDIFGSGDEESNFVAGEAPAYDSGYVFDELSGYYYNSAIGYYYDSSTGLFYGAASGKWLRFDESSNSYLEVVEEQAGEVEQ